MIVIKRVILFSLLYAAISLALLILFPKFQAALAQASGAPTTATQPKQPQAPQKPIPGAPAPASPTTQEFVDIARLVVESSRDSTSHLALYIERATMLVIIFFSVLGAAGTVFGLKKADDFQRRADLAAGDVEQGLKTAKAKIEAFEQEQRAAMQKLVTALNEELRDYAELMTARMDIGRAMNDPIVKNDQPAAARLLQAAATRILTVVKNERVSVKDRLRGFAEAAFALKRTGSTDEAYTYIQKAIALAEENQTLAVLHYNAACYASILGKNTEAIAHLTIAVNTESAFKSKALADPDCQGLLQLQAFQALVQ